MFVYSKASKSRFVHFNHCGYGKIIKKENSGYFYSLKEARMNGYYLYPKTDPLYIDYCENKCAIEKVCRDNNISCKYDEGKILVVTQDSEWIIVTEGMHRKTLYHRDQFSWCGDEKSEFRGFHTQKTWGYDCRTIEKCLKFILKHDRYRKENKIVYFDARKHNEPAKRGTNRWKKEENMRRRIGRRKEIERVNMLINMVSDGTNGK